MELQKRRYTVEEYLEIDNAALDEKYEYRDGEIVNIRDLIAMAGGSIFHSLIVMNTGGALISRLKGSSCRVFDSNLRVAIPRKTLYAYPDITVICGPIQRELNDRTGQTATNPKVIIEVLSPSTEAYDRGKKFDRYLQIETLEQYVLISQDGPHVQTYLRQKDGNWLVSFSSGAESTAKLQSLGIELPLSEIFAGVEWESVE